MDDTIVDLLKNRDYKGLELLIDHLGNDIIKTIRAVLNRAEEYSYHKDAENEVFYSLWKNIAQFDATKSSLKTWALTVARNASIDKKRQILRKQDILPLDQVNEHAVYDHYFEKEQFLALIGSLNPEDQLIFLNYYFYKETPQEISALLNMEVSQVYNRLSRGRKKLKVALEKEENNGKYF